MAAKKARRKKRKTAEERQFDKAERVLRRNWKRILARKGVTHVDVNYRTREGERTDEVVIRVHVEEKIREEELHSNRRLESIEGVPVDVVESLNTYGQQHAKAAGGGFPTLQGGVKIAPSHNSSAAGTLGIVCFTKPGGRLRYLTNAHVVLGGRKKSQLPADPRVIQPRPGGGASRTIGRTIKSKCFRQALVDCALIRPIPGQKFRRGVLKILANPEGIGQLTFADIKQKVRVRKMGAATGGTTGIVDSVTLTFSVPGNRFLFQIGIKRVPSGKWFSDFGDSGAVVIRGKKVVGLLHGLTNDRRIAVASHMKFVADKLKISL